MADKILIGNDCEAIDLRPQYSDVGYGQRPLDFIQDLIVHHSVTNVADPLEDIRKIHDYDVNSHGWPGFSYHFAIDRAGLVYYCGDVLTVRYHTASSHSTGGISDANWHGVAIVVLGNYEDGTHSFDGVLKSALDKLYANLQFSLGRFIPFSPHRFWTATACPGQLIMDSYSAERKRLASFKGF